ncbi:glycosyltransferase family 2 protein [Wenxinia saemankumensis]|uniref:Glycosyl transferase family 2 n=1 Tax=Wenxinia saemankumensis TaxID=1447782 RepID=A0A1M5ZYP2_9RHOB|nr:glycosyltransferase [Wenxinia saemankumensis]SHI29360.1 Glycosyl transferase family 2 [Wenxinia saemankumensis]
MRVSVIIPVRDGGPYLAPAIRSALNQTSPPAEVIVVDNGSTDGSAEVAAGFGPAVHLVRCARRGAPAARNLGAEEATGDALMFLDADDLLGPSALAAMTRALAPRRAAIAACPWRRYVKEGEAWIPAPASTPPRRPDQDDLAAWITGWYHPPCSVLWSRDAFELTGGWNEALAVNQDGELMMRALASGTPLVRSREGLAYYRRLPGDAVSLSGMSRTPRGLAARLSVLEGIEGRLAGEDKLGRYRAALAEGFASIAQESAGVDPGTAEAAGRGVSRNGGFGRARRLHRTAARAAGRRRERSRIPIGPAAPVPDREPGDQPDPLVSVILPTFQRAGPVRTAIRSVLDQTYPRLELLVIDDGSTDGTDETVAGFDDPRLRYIRLAGNRGVAAARNRGLSEARGALLAFLDSDDEWMPEKTARQVALMGRRPSRVGLCHTGLRLRTSGETWSPSLRGDVLPEILAGNVVHFGTSSVMIRREVADAVGGFDETLPANEDHDYWARIGRFYDFDVLPEPLMIYDDGPGQAETGERRSRNFAANMAARDLFVSRHGIEAARLGMRWRYQMDSARRHLDWDDGDARAGRWLLAKAARDRPAHPAAYVLLALSVLPRPIRAGLSRRLGQFWGRLRSARVHPGA